MLQIRKCAIFKILNVACLADTQNVKLVAAVGDKTKQQQKNGGKMFEENDYDGGDEITAAKVEILKKRLEDIVDRLYSCDDRFPIDNDEVHASITAMANILGVHVPDNALSIKFKLWGAEYVEDVINENLYDVKRIYTGWSQSATFSLLRSLVIEKDFDLLTVGDIADFCYSDYFIKKCEEAGNVL